MTTIGPAAGGHLPWAPQKDFSAYTWTPDIQTDQYMIRHHKIPSHQAIDEAELVIQCDANFFLTNNFRCPNVVWAVDNHVARYDETHFDLFFGAHSWGYGSERKDFHWLPCAYDPEAHYVIPNVAKPFDLACIGVMYPKRIELVEALSKHGSVLVGQGILGKEYNEAYNSARIALVQSARGDVPMRLFENAAQGLCILCDRQHDLGKLGLMESTDYWGFDSVNGVVDTFQYLLTHPEMLQQTASFGKEALAAHTYEARAQTIIDTCQAQGLL